MDQHLIILGASTRAAAFSALRANLRPWCVDLFGDVDLRGRCPTTTIAPRDFPARFGRLLRQAPPGPWLYTGALENRPGLVRQLARKRPLWGNDWSVLAAVRSPQAVHTLLSTAGIPSPAVALDPAALPPEGRWLVKPRRGAGGRGIRYWSGQPLPQPTERDVYFQSHIEGEACAAIYSSNGTATSLLGVTRQLVGETWVQAAPFHYCGSIGPMVLAPPLREAFARLGNILASGCGVRGLFGIDCIVRDGFPWLLEVNPRYTASVEVLEYAAGLSALGWHRSAFDAAAPEPPPASADIPRQPVGKGILFAKAPLTFPSEGPWLDTLRSPGSVHDLPAFADIPCAGRRIAAGRPILTFFVRGDSVEACRDSLQRTAADLDRWLFGA